MPVSIELPDDLAEQLRSFAGARGEDLNHWAVATLAAAAGSQIAAGSPNAAAAPLTMPLLRPYRDYPSRAAYIAAAREAAPARGLDTDYAAALAEGIADEEEGATLSLEEARAVWDHDKAVWRGRAGTQALSADRARKG